MAAMEPRWLRRNVSQRSSAPGGGCRRGRHWTCKQAWTYGTKGNSARPLGSKHAEVAANAYPVAGLGVLLWHMVVDRPFLFWRVCRPVPRLPPSTISLLFLVPRVSLGVSLGIAIAGVSLGRFL